MNKDEWYLAYTKPRAEITGTNNIRNQGFEVFFPKITFERLGSKKEKLKVLIKKFVILYLNFVKVKIQKLQ